jgi:hypothetical protein
MDEVDVGASVAASAPVVKRSARTEKADDHARVRGRVRRGLFMALSRRSKGGGSRPVRED